MLWNSIETLTREFDPWKEFEEMRKTLQNLEREMERIFGTDDIPVSGGYPPVNVWINSEGAYVAAELPGVKPEDVEITVVGKSLKITGKRPEEEGKDARYHLKERWHGEFARTIELPFHVDPDKVEAKFSRGLLTVNLPRAEEEKPRKITVEAA
ncbi:MAG TPA: Hsp20/alpha crystallin family protein [Nitrospirae bacterium]|nr:Hsp20/alpha crystallin family protein [Nitrospirota bacterium]